MALVNIGDEIVERSEEGLDQKVRRLIAAGASPMEIYQAGVWLLGTPEGASGLGPENVAERVTAGVLKAGGSPELAQQVAAIGQQSVQNRAKDEGFLEGMVNSGVDFVKDPLIPLALAGAGTYAGAAGLGGLLPAGGATAGAANAAELAGTYGGMDAGAITAASDAGTLIPAAAGAAGAAGGASAGGTAAGAAASGGALSRVLAGTATADDWLSLAGKVAPAALGAYASNEQANKLGDLADKYMGFGAPSRARYEASFAPGFTMANDPGYTDALDQATKSFLHKASISGNPSESPNAWQQTLKDVNSQFAYPALQEYRRQAVGAGGLATLTAAAPGAATGEINAQRGIYDAIGAGAADVFNPPKSLEELARAFKRAGF